MPFTVDDFRDLLRLMKEKPEWAEELRQAVLTKELLELPGLVRELTATVRELAEAQRRHYEEFCAYREETERRFRELAEAQRRTEERVERLEQVVAGLVEAQKRTEERVNALAEAQKRTEEELRELVKAQRQMKETQDRFAQIIGPAVEARMVAAVRGWLSERGYRLLQPIVSVPLDGIGEIDGVAKAVAPEGEEIWLLVSVKAKVWARDVKDFAALLSISTTQAALREFGIKGEVLPLIFGMVMDYRVPQAASEARIGLILEAQGEVVPAERWVVEETEERD